MLAGSTVLKLKDKWTDFLDSDTMNSFYTMCLKNGLVGSPQPAPKPPSSHLITLPQQDEGDKRKGKSKKKM